MKALIIGSNGQDGRLLTSFLEEKKYSVIGVGRRDLNIFDKQEMNSFIKTQSPDEIYYLAAFHHSAQNLPMEESNLNELSMKVHAEGFVNLLNAIALNSKKSKVFYASSSHIFCASEELLIETSPLDPSSAYAKSKIAGMEAAQGFRHSGIFVACGILFNHESTFRSPEFVSRKITRGVARIVNGVDDSLVLGNLNAVLDWGYAGDYVEAMWKVLQLPVADDFIISTGIPRTIRDFVEIAFSSQGLDYQKYVVIQDSLLKKKSERRIGDFSKIHSSTGWSPRTSFSDMIKTMVENDLKIIN